MSDYEGEGWNPAALAGPVRYDKQSITDHVAPRGQRLPYIPPKNFRDGKNAKRSLGPHAAKSLQPFLQSIGPRVRYGPEGRLGEQPTGNLVVQQDPMSLRRFQQNPDNPDGFYELDIPWKGLLRAIPAPTALASGAIARSDLDRIGVFSEAFIKTPDGNSTRVEIWGNEAQCAKAKSRLQAWEGHLRSTGARPSHKSWVKEHAFDGRKEDRKRQQQWQELEDQALQEFDDSYFRFDAYLIWPNDFDLETYLKKYETDTLKEIAKEFRCRFSHEKRTRPRSTKVQAETEENLLSAYQRLINLVKEMLALRKRGAYGNFCSLPSPEIYRSHVKTQGILKTKQPPHVSLLTGDEKPEADRDEWFENVIAYEKQNRVELKSSLNHFFKTLHVSRSHVRLRVSFGDLLLNAYQRSSQGTQTYGFEEFVNIVQNRRTVLTEPMLRYYQEDMAPLVDKMYALEDFQHPVEYYRQVFEFKGVDSLSRLRLEIEMQPGYDYDEPQVCSQRWLSYHTHSKQENVLGLKVFNFEKPGYMIRADSYDLFTNDNIIKDMEAFHSAVKYKPSADGIKAFPKLRSAFPNHSKLEAVIEYTSVKFQLKNTDGIVEFRREDKYLQNNGVPNKLPDSTKFELLYYYPEWDNLLGELSNLKPGEDVQWRRDLETFFPSYIDPDRPKFLPRKFKNFMKEVYRLQDLLRDLLNDSPVENTA